MKNKIILIGITLLIGVLLLMNVYAINTCCERLKNEDGSPGPWCQDTENPNECHDDFQAITGLVCNIEAVPGADRTFQAGYCEIGTCIDSEEGTCSASPEQVCLEELGGSWKNGLPEEHEQCNIGCCVLGQEVKMSTRVSCIREASDIGLEPVFRADVQTVTECAGLGNLDEEGACTFQQNFIDRCLITTKENCDKLQAGQEAENLFGNYYGSNDNLEGLDQGSVEFHSGLLCSSPELGNICLPSEDTIPYNDKVYFLDTCRNMANIYDYNKRTLELDQEYWTFPLKGEDICTLTWSSDGSITNQDTCGNCNFESIARYNPGVAGVGDYVCESRICDSGDDMWAMDFYDRYGRYAYDGESWCAQKSDSTILDINQTRGAIQILPGLEPDIKTQNLPGTEYYKLICQDGRVTKPELCMPRGEVCAETTMEYDFLAEEGAPVVSMQKAVCMVNRHEFCVEQTNMEDCLNTLERDCEWIFGFSVQKDEEGKSVVYNDSNGNGQHDMESEPWASCLPKIPPATGTTCAGASETCVVEYIKRGVLSGKEFKMEHCVKNCYCLEGFTGPNDLNSFQRKKYMKTDPEYPNYNAWARSHEEACLRLGDCGVKENYKGDTGVNTKWVVVVEKPEEEE